MIPERRCGAVPTPADRRSSGNFYGAATEGGKNGGGTSRTDTANGSWNFSDLQRAGLGHLGSFRNVVSIVLGIFTAPPMRRRVQSGTV